MALAFGGAPGIRLPGKRLLELNPDPLFFLSVTTALPMFGNFTGTLDSSGKASAWVDIPRDPALYGLQFAAAFLTFNPSSPGGIHAFSKSTVVSIR